MRYSITTIGACIGLSSSAVLAQNPGQNVTVNVVVDTVITIGDTTSVSYHVANLASSTEPLWVYYVDTPSGVRSMAPSTGSFRWRTGTNFNGRPMAGWMFLYGYLQPGETTPTLSFKSVGLAAIRTFWAGGYVPLPSAVDTDVTESTVLADPFVTEMINGQTVGVEPWPADRSGQALLLRLRSLTENNCSGPLNWITDSSLCGQLLNDLNQAEIYRANGEPEPARAAIVDYEGRLAGGKAVGTVSSPSYWLLRSNAGIVRSTL